MPRRSSSILRRSLRYCTAEGAVAEVVGACCGGAALTGWALYLGMDARLVGLVTALPIVAQALQAAGAMLTARFGYRRTALVAIAVSRQAFLPLAFLPVLPLDAAGRRTLLLGVAGLHHGVGILANNAWSVWFGEMVPRQLRGRYFGRRTALCAVAGGACALAAGLALDRGGHGKLAGPVLQSTAILASAAGVASVLLLARQHGADTVRMPALWALRSMVRPLRHPAARKVIAYSAVWNGACGLSAPFFGLFLLEDLRTGYALLAAQGAGLAVARVASATAWGRAVDRLGARRVLIGCTAGLALSPLAWVGCRSDRLWPLVAETAVGGVLFGGHAVASFALPLSVAPRRARPFYLAVTAMAGGVAFAATSVVGCMLTGSAGVQRVPIRALLVASAALRVGAVGASLAVPRSRCEAAAAADARAAQATAGSDATPFPVPVRDAA